MFDSDQAGEKVYRVRVLREEIEAFRVSDRRIKPKSKRGEMDSEQGSNFEAFMQAVKSSVEEHAHRKGYVNGKPEASEILKALGIQTHHHIGEILMKLREYEVTHNPVLLEKCAGWCWLLYRSDAEDKRKNITALQKNSEHVGCS